MKPIKGLVNSIVNEPRGKQRRLTWPVWLDLVKVVRMQSLRWSNVSRLERWVCRKVDVLRGQSSV